MNKSLPADQAATLKRTYEALRPFRELRETMPMQYVTTFLLVATDENQNVTEYAKRAGASQSIMSRHMADLGAVDRYHEAGFGLVETYEDALDRRNKRVRLTSKGHHVVWEMCEAQRN
jgi:DNA-binding MarR family transcriptional regulator